MFRIETSFDFQEAVRLVEKDGFSVNQSRVLALLYEMYKLKGKGKMSGRFLTIRDQARKNIGGSPDLFDWVVDKLVVGRFFNPRAVRANKRGGAWKPKVLEASAQGVRVQVFPEIILFFVARREKGKLKWSDVELLDKEVLSGSPCVPNAPFKKAKKIALMAMNGRKERY